MHCYTTLSLSLQNQKIFDVESPHHRRYYAKSGSIIFNDVNAGFIEAFRHGVETITSPYCMVEMIGLGGAVKDFPAERSAFFPLRSQDWLVNVVSSWQNDNDAPLSPNETDPFDEKHIDWCRKTFFELSTNLPGYINMMADSTEETKQERLMRAFGTNIKQLRIVRGRYDPKNFFRHNVNIFPALEEKHHGQSITSKPRNRQILKSLFKQVQIHFTNIVSLINALE